jgi:hypothetical protein
MKSTQSTGHQMAIAWPAAPRIDCSKSGASELVNACQRIGACC